MFHLVRPFYILGTLTFSFKPSQYKILRPLKTSETFSRQNKFEDYRKHLHIQYCQQKDCPHNIYSSSFNFPKYSSFTSVLTNSVTHTSGPSLSLPSLSHQVPIHSLETRHVFAIHCVNKSVALVLAEHQLCIHTRGLIQHKPGVETKAGTHKAANR